ncbi:hypothetical protein [Castellaniella sp.]|uniref:hypothetical protein n=1 Tax=Castellaniella sp. TaxID=1955812 RepID=UPI00355F87AE
MWHPCGHDLIGSFVLQAAIYGIIEYSEVFLVGGIVLGLVIWVLLLVRQMLSKNTSKNTS